MESELLPVTLPENLSPALTEKLKLLGPGTYCLHRSWGFGRIKDWDSVHESVIIDFKSKHGHVMQYAYAAESLTALAPDHVSVQKVESAPALRKKALDDPDRGGPGLHPQPRPASHRRQHPGPALPRCRSPPPITKNGGTAPSAP